MPRFELAELEGPGIPGLELELLEARGIAAITRGIDPRQGAPRSAGPSRCGTPADLDETRRLAYAALYTRFTGGRAELVATLVNALAHHGLAIDPSDAVEHIVNLAHGGEHERWLQSQIDRVTAELGFPAVTVEPVLIAAHGLTVVHHNRLLSGTEPLQLSGTEPLQCWHWRVSGGRELTTTGISRPHLLHFPWKHSGQTVNSDLDGLVLGTTARHQRHGR